MKEETCLILDFLPEGYADRRKSEPIAQAMGTSFFSLLELVPRESITLTPEEEVYIGDGKRDKIRFIRGQLEYNELTTLAKTLMPEIVEKLVRRNEQRFVEFFNKASTVTPRMHQFQLLPGVGKKHLSDILDERRKKGFENFDDIRQRVKLFPDPVKTLVLRVMQELEGNEKYYLFVYRQQRKQEY
jgi:putative nucleotide binding protein